MSDKLPYRDLRDKVAVEAAVTPRELYGLMDVLEHAYWLATSLPVPKMGAPGSSAFRRLSAALDRFDWEQDESPFPAASEPSDTLSEAILP